MPFAGEDEHEEEEDEKPWNPEDENLERDYMKFAREFMKVQMDHMKQMKEGPSQAQPARPESSYRIGLAVPMPQGTPSSQILFRKIDNGFLLSYLQIKEAPLHPHPMEIPTPKVVARPVDPKSNEAIQAAQAMEAAQIEKAILAPHRHMRRIEVFVKDHLEAASHLQDAMESAERIAKLGPGALYL